MLSLPIATNETVEQLAANNLTMPQDAIASLLQRLVRNDRLTNLEAFADSGVTRFAA